MTEASPETGHEKFTCRHCGALLLNRSSGKYITCSDMCRGSRLMLGQLRPAIQRLHLTKLHIDPPECRMTTEGHYEIDGIPGRFEKLESVNRTLRFLPGDLPEGAVVAIEGERIFILGPLDEKDE